MLGYDFVITSGEIITNQIIEHVMGRLLRMMELVMMLLVQVLFRITSWSSFLSTALSDQKDA